MGSEIRRVLVSENFQRNLRKDRDLIVRLLKRFQEFRYGFRIAQR